MSRLVTTKAGCPETTIAFGLDHAFGWFYQEFKNGNLILDLDSLFSGLSRGRLLELLEETEASDEHKVRVALDLDPAG